MTELPKIFVALDYDTGEHILMARSFNITEPAGARLFKTPPHPLLEFRHETKAAAKKDAALLQQYIDEKWATKAPSKAKLRKAHD